MSATPNGTWFRRRPDPMQSIVARGGVTFIAVFHFGYFLMALVTLSFPELAIGIGLPFLGFAMRLIWRRIPSDPGRSYGGGLIKKVSLEPGEQMLLDVPVRWGKWPFVTMGHLLVTGSRIVVTPFGFGGPSITALPLGELRSIARVRPAGLAARFINEGDNIELRGARTLRVRPTPGFAWMGGFSTDELERDVREALDRAGWTPTDEAT